MEDPRTPGPPGVVWAGAPGSSSWRWRWPAPQSPRPSATSNTQPGTIAWPASSGTSPPPNCPDPCRSVCRTFRRRSSKLATANGSHPVIPAASLPAHPPPGSRYTLSSPLVPPSPATPPVLVAHANAPRAIDVFPGTARAREFRRRQEEFFPRSGGGVRPTRFPFTAVADQ